MNRCANAPGSARARLACPRSMWLAIVLMCLSAGSALSQETCNIAGQVLVDEEGTLYVHLVDEEQFAVPFTGIQEVVMPVGVAEVAAGDVEFAFSALPPGRYGIRVFIDTNGNRELDRGLFGPREPWGMSWQVQKLFRIPRFDDIAFTLNNDLVGVVIETQ